MRCRFYEFPSGEDRAVVERAVQVFLTSQNSLTRSLMLRTARAVLDKFHVSRLPLNGYAVEKTPEPGWAMITGGQEVTGRNCPGCGADIYVWPGKVRILSILEGLRFDEVTYGCECGRIFRKKEAVV
ncbi:MAG: hypothetical protein ACPLRH_00045 [Desulfotomaculales bacterium]